MKLTCGAMPFGYCALRRLEEDKKLGALVLPPELEPAVYVFRRRNAS